MDEAEVTRWTTATALLDEVLELPSGQQGEAAGRLGAQHDVRAELEALLEGVRRGSALDSSLDSILGELPDSHPTRDALKGMTFGRWVLGEEIGRGGMSVVYHATRVGADFEQRAALKILSVGFLGEEFVAGFVRERQILSNLRHPGIARLIDGGLTPDGAPFLVMDFVEGERIDRWCAEHRASPETVARLMLKLCRAVAYAQQHLVVHRDINPRNVLVDQRGEPILIDFGIAKLLGDAPGGRTLKAFTPNFAAPEQRTGGVITTATDVYALGVVFRSLIGDHKPDRDLDLVLRVATHEDQEQRYQNARSLADDVEAWVQRRPVRARPDSLLYRSRKFARRHWQWLTAANVAVVIAIAALVATSQQASVTRQEARKRQAIADFMVGLFQQADLMRSGADLRVTDLLAMAAVQAESEFAGDPQTLAPLLILMAGGQLELTRYDEADRLLNLASNLINEHEASVPTRAEYHVQRGRQAYELGDFESAARQIKLTMKMTADQSALRELWLMAGANLVSYLVDAEQYDEARLVADMLVIEVSEGPASEAARKTVTHRHALALEVTGDLDAAFGQYQRALELQKAHQPNNPLGRASILSDYAIALYFANRFEESEIANREVLALYEAQFDPPHPRISSAIHNVAFSLVGQQRYEQAAELLEQSLSMSVALHGPEHIDSLLEEATLATVIARMGDYERAEAIFRSNLEVLDRVAPEMYVQRGAVHSYLADVMLQTGRLVESRAQYKTALEMFRELPDDHVRVVEVNERLAEYLAAKATSRIKRFGVRVKGQSKKGEYVASPCYNCARPDHDRW